MGNIRALDREAMVDAILLIDKPLGWTSFDVVAKIRNISGVKRVGHCGTLDPLATGLLIVCTGKMTKGISVIQDADKEYEFECCLGASTSTYDNEVPPTIFVDTSHITKELIIEKAKKFVGEIEQVPPVYSAIKVNGKRAYALARKGVEFELKSRIVRVNSFVISDFSPPNKITGVISCGKGTYIRSLANDLGTELGVGGYLTALRRTRIGNYLIDNAFEMK